MKWTRITTSSQTILSSFFLKSRFTQSMSIKIQKTSAKMIKRKRSRNPARKESSRIITNQDILIKKYVIKLSDTKGVCRFYRVKKMFGTGKADGKKTNSLMKEFLFQCIYICCNEFCISVACLIRKSFHNAFAFTTDSFKSYRTTISIANKSSGAFSPLSFTVFFISC